MERKNNPIKWPLLALLLYIPLSTALMLLVKQTLFHYLCPLGFLKLFLAQWFDPWWLMLLLCLLPLAGWFLLHRGMRDGKKLLSPVLWFLLGANLLVFMLHFITSLSGHNLPLLQDAVRLALACPIVCIPALVLTNKWYPKI